MNVIAEGIETAKQHQHLKAAGVHGLQGYLFGKPMSAADLTARLRSQLAKAG
jgi:EAL domain-containing protein (putative c-di-GMP-specific phosphodiesterase class I)